MKKFQVEQLNCVFGNGLQMYRFVVISHRAGIVMEMRHLARARAQNMCACVQGRAQVSAREHVSMF